MKKHKSLLLALFAILLLVACKEGLPKGILSQGKMEEVLYDYHRAEAVARQLNVDSTTQALYMDAVLAKNDVSRADFDSSMVYYFRHMELMQEVYANLEKRIEAEAADYGLAGAFGSDMELTGDTANIWTGASAQVLMLNRPYNIITYSIPADTAFHKGDRFMLRFSSQFLYQDGTRHGTAVIAMRLSNDSVVVRNTRLSSSGSTMLEVSDTERQGVKELRGFILHNTPTREEERTSTTMRMLMLNDIKLIRMHTQEEVKADTVAVDSIKVDSVKTTADSVRQTTHKLVQPMRKPTPLKLKQAKNNTSK